MNIRTRFITLALLILTGVGISLPSSAQGPTRLSGRVVDKDYNPLANVNVQAERGSERSKVFTTKEDGEYIVGLGSGTPIEKVTYTPTDKNFHYAEVKLLSGKQDTREQHIVKVLERTTAKLSTVKAVDTLSAYEHRALAAVEAKSGEERDLAIKRIREAGLIERLSSLQVASVNQNVNLWLNRRKKEILQLYSSLFNGK